jgi:hypothetical protein
MKKSNIVLAPYSSVIVLLMHLIPKFWIYKGELFVLNGLSTFQSDIVV